MLLTSCVVTLLAAAPPAPKPLPSLAKPPIIDGELRDLAPALAPTMPSSAKGSSASLKLTTTFRKDTLYVGVTITDDAVTDADSVDVSLYFPDTGVTSRGAVYRFGTDGLREAPPDVAAADFAHALVTAVFKKTKTGAVLEAAFPLRSLPRMRARPPLVLSLCVDYADDDGTEAEPSKLTTCPSGEMAGGPTRLPDEALKQLKRQPPAEVTSLEARASGWLGYGTLHFPRWVLGDAPLTSESLAELVTEGTAVSPERVQLPPVKLTLHDQPIITILTGKNPYATQRCDENAELRMALYVTEGDVARRVLEWPASTCMLGRAMRVELGSEGTLEIAYTNGATHHFVWTVDHFERSELGAR